MFLINVRYLYICLMELRVCPVCERKGLLPTATNKVAKRRIMCENETYIHFRLGLVEFLAKTDQAKIEEIIEGMFHGELALN